MPQVNINNGLGKNDPPDNKVTIYNDCSCIVNTVTGLNPIAQKFIDEMAAAGTYYSAQEQIALDGLVNNLLLQTGAAELSFVTSLPVSGDFGILYVLNYKGIYFWNGTSYDYAISKNDFTDAYKTKLDNAVLSVNGTTPDVSGNVSLTISS